MAGLRPGRRGRPTQDRNGPRRRLLQRGPDQRRHEASGHGRQQGDLGYQEIANLTKTKDEIKGTGVIDWWSCGTIARMPRRARSIVGGYAYHVLNRANGRLRLFKKEADFRRL